MVCTSKPSFTSCFDLQLIAMDALPEKFDACLLLFNSGGGCVNIKYSGSFDVIQNLFETRWILAHHENLSMLTVELPSWGCFSLMHPNITMWELDKHDIYPSEEDE